MVRLLSRITGRHALRCIGGINGRISPRIPFQWHPPRLLARFIHDDETANSGDDVEHEAQAAGEVSPVDARIEQFKKAFNLPIIQTLSSSYKPGLEATLVGFLGKRRDQSSNLSFCYLSKDNDFGWNNVQVVSSCGDGDDAQAALHQSFKRIPFDTPVVVKGTLRERPKPKSSTEGGKSKYKPMPTLPRDMIWDLELKSIHVVNQFSKNIVISPKAVYTPRQRYLQMRFDHALRDRLYIRSELTRRIRHFLCGRDFQEIETPILFKSTPEGAREFLVPTRRAGHAYALPQSPQQYKQVLMAGGIPCYFQFARCFRDEDLRADRQPEFTQLDLEMSFTSPHHVRKIVEGTIRVVAEYFNKFTIPTIVNGALHPRPIDRVDKREPNKGRGIGGAPEFYPLAPAGHFRVWSYDWVMTRFGTDKPDCRIAGEICSISDIVPQNFVKMLTKMEDPIVEAVQFRLQGTLEEKRAFVRDFMDKLPKTTLNIGKESTPGVFMVDETQPLGGLSALGHEGSEQLANMDSETWKKLQHGDIVMVHARKNEPFRGEGSTELGRMRKAIYDAAVASGLLPKDYSFNFVWVNAFPMFTPNDPVDVAAGEGQGGDAGFSATHHPFTAPHQASDFDQLFTDPLSAKGSSFDLVLNGVEVGGGSRRIHVAELQEYVMRDVLKMSDDRVKLFDHLLDALRAGCPPHSGFALGFDRLLAIMCGVESVRDVMAFPKSFKGEDLLVGSPAKMTDEQLETYHLARRKNKPQSPDADGATQVSPIDVLPTETSSPLSTSTSTSAISESTGVTDEVNTSAESTDSTSTSTSPSS